VHGHFDAARVRILVPDARSAFGLEQRLRHLHAVAVGRGPRWEVDLELYEGRADEIAATVRAWLADVGRARATVVVDGDSLEVTGS
jgi:predicted thioesterase